ncbi:MAG: zinc metalloprotease HtpX [Nanoarchaeota archaeon]
MSNQFKTVMLLATLAVIMLLIGWLIGGKTGLVVALLFSVLLNFLTYWFSDRIVLAMYRAKPATGSKYTELNKMVADVAKSAKVPKPKVYVVPLEVPNAFATGRNPENAVVAVTDGILKKLNKEELKGVIAHEIAHVKNKDILVATIAATIAGVISYIAFMARFAAFDEEGRGSILTLIGIILVSILAPIMAMLVQMAISRSREFIADEGGAGFVRTGEPLASALQKLESESKKKPLKGAEGTAHLFIVSPLSGQGIAHMFSTHPPIEERVKRLRAMKF